MTNGMRIVLLMITDVIRYALHQSYSYVVERTNDVDQSESSAMVESTNGPNDVYYKEWESRDLPTSDVSATDHCASKNQIYIIVYDKS